MAVGGDVELTMKLDPKSNTEVGVNAVEIHVTFDHTKLQLNSITKSNSFGTVFQDAIIDNNLGIASIVLITPSQPDIKAIADIGSFSFHAIATGVSSVIITNDSNAALNDGKGTMIVANMVSSTITVDNSVDNIAPNAPSNLIVK